jgi:hypothetical protein
LSKPQQTLLLTLFPSILLGRGKVNFPNLSRYSQWSEKTYRRHYKQPFSFTQFNALLIEPAIASNVTQMGGNIFVLGRANSRNSLYFRIFWELFSTTQHWVMF